MHQLLKKSLIIFSALFLIHRVYGQQLPLYSDYMMNGFVLNPAVAGSEGYTTIGLSTRDHWVGLDNSPKTYVISAQWRILRQGNKVSNNAITKKKEVTKHSGRIGLGVYVFNDVNGLIERTGAQFTYAYHLFIQNRQLSFGLALNTFQFKIATDQFHPRTPSDPIFNSNFQNKMLVPDATGGIYLLSYDSFLGLSVSNLFQSRIRIGSDTYDFRIYRHYYLMGGKRFNKDNIFSFEPSFLVKASEKMAFQTDMQIREYYSQDYYLGLIYRTGSAIGIQIGAKWDRFYFSYAFDYTLSGLQSHTYGSHELNVALKLGDNARRYKCLIRY